MKTLILSPHTDDAIFSLGHYIEKMEDVTILSIFSGIPEDYMGIRKHGILRQEHAFACSAIGAGYINLDFLDDVYEPRPSIDEILSAIAPCVEPYQQVLCPIGIHHPDHLLLRAAIDTQPELVDQYYQDLPYATLYPEEKEKAVSRLSPQSLTQYFPFEDSLKMKAVLCYQSQIQNDHILKEIFVREEIYATTSIL